MSRLDNREVLQSSSTKANNSNHRGSKSGAVMACQQLMMTLVMILHQRLVWVV